MSDFSFKDELNNPHFIENLLYAARIRIESNEAVIEEIEAELKRLKRATEGLKTSTKWLSRPENGIIANCFDGWEYFDSSTLSLLRMSISIGEYICPKYSSIVQEWFSEITDECGFIKKNPFDICIFSIDDITFFRVPLLRKKFTPVSTAYDNWYGLRRWKNAFDDEVLHMIRDRIREEKFDPWTYAKTTLHYLFLTDRKDLLCDADNYDTATITNVIMHNTAGGDGPGACRFIYDSKYSKEVKEGTYITLMPMEKHPFTPEEIIRIWSEHEKKTD